MRNLATTLAVVTLLTSAQPIMAQYQQQVEKTVSANKPLSSFSNQQHVLFNFGWKFKSLNDPEDKADLSSPQLDDSSWRTLDLPHDFQFEQPWTKKAKGSRGFKPMCAGWYRKTFRVPQEWKGLDISLDFGGIIYYGDVYINGHKIASTDYGYVGLEANMTQYLKYGQDNVVAVYASTGPNKGSRWYTGGGLFRDVFLDVKNPTHIARHGLYVTTPEVSASASTVQLQVALAGWKMKNTKVKAYIRNAEGQVVAKTEKGIQVYSHQSVIELSLPQVKITNPHLWSPDTPYLYIADAVVEVDGVTVDSIRDEFGIRKLEYSPEYGFKLNGKKIFLQGNAGHHDLGALGAAAFDKGIERMMKRLKEFGYNTIRCSHNPYSENFYKIADRVGMLVVDELFDKWSDDAYWGGRQPLTNIWYRLIPEWIKRDRNRPSVILWSLGNELQIRNEWAGFDGMNDWGVTTYKVFDQVVKRFDKTRPTTVAQFPARAGAISRKDSGFNSYLVPPELGCATEVAALNYQSARYKDYLKYKPDLNIFQSEAETYNLLAPYYNMDREHSIGLAYWGSIEYWGESNGWPKKGWNYSFFNHTMTPYPQAYLIRSAFKPNEPLVRLAVLDKQGKESVSWNDVTVGKKKMLDYWNFPENSQQTVMAYTNAASVELLVNGKSLGKKQNDATKNDQRGIVVWENVDYGKGGSIEAIARDAEGKVVARHQMETAGDAVALRITPETTQWKGDGMDLLYLNVEAVDKKGRRVPGFNQPLKVGVEGEASLQAIDNGDHHTNDLFYQVNTKPMLNGWMQVILRSKNLQASNRNSAKVKVVVSAGKMKKSIVLNETK